MRLTSFFIGLLLFLFLSFLASYDFGSMLLAHRQSKKEITSDFIYVPQQIVTRDDLKSIDVLIVGGSSTREFFPHETDLDDLLSKSCGVSLRGFNAATSSQSLQGSIAVIEEWSERFGFPERIVFGMSFARAFTQRPQRIGLPLSSVSKAPHPFWANYMAQITDRFDRLSRLSNLLSSGTWVDAKSHPIENRHGYKTPGTPLQSRITTSLALADMYERFGLQSASENIRLLREVMSFDEAGKRAVFVYTPISPIVHKSYKNIFNKNAHLENLLKIGPVVDLLRISSLVDAHFFDEQHLLPSGRKDFWTSAEGIAVAKSIFCPPERS